MQQLELTTACDLTTLLIAIELANEIDDPIGRYQALNTIAAGFGLQYTQAAHLSALYLGGAVYA